jgi:hypothetical protein
MKSIALVAGAALALLGCTTSPPYPSKTLDVVEINNAILTELYCAAIRLQGNAANTYWASPQGTPKDLYFNSQDNWVAAVDLYLSASVDGVASPAVSLLGPYNMARAIAPGGTTGSFTALFGASVDQTRTNLREYKVYVFLPELIRSWNPPPNTNCNDPNQGRTYLAGTLGLEDWLTPAVINLQNTQRLAPDPTGYNGKTSSLWIDKTKVAKRGHAVSPKIVRVADNKPSDPNTTQSDGVKLAQIDPEFARTLSAMDFLLANQGGGGGGQPPTISATLTFTIKATGTLGPSFMLTRVSGGSGSAFTLSRTDNNYVNIVLTPATYCPTAISYVPPNGPTNPGTATCTILTATIGSLGTLEFKPQTRESLNNGVPVPTPQDMQLATNRLDNALSNLNLAHLVTP